MPMHKGLPEDPDLPDGGVLTISTQTRLPHFLEKARSRLRLSQVLNQRFLRVFVAIWVVYLTTQRFFAPHRMMAASTPKADIPRRHGLFLHPQERP